VTAAGVVSFLRALDTFQPLGFEARRAAGGWTVTSVAPGAGDDGLRAGDQILLAGGTEVADLDPGLGQILRRRQSTDLVVLRDGALTEAVYRRPPLEVDWPYLILALIGSFYLLIGFYTVLRERRSETTLFYVWCLASASVYMFTPSGLGDATGRVLYAAEEVARALLPPLTLHLFLVFPRPLERGAFRARARARARAAVGSGGIRAIPFLYLPAAVLLTLQISLMVFAGRGIDPGRAAAALPVLDRASLVHLVLFALLALGVLVFRLGRRRDWEEQRQLQWIALGLGAGYVPFLVLYVVPYTLGAGLSGPVTALAVIPLAVVPLTFAWAILRYKLWDIAVVVRESVSTTLTVLLAGAAFGLAHLAVSRALPEHLGLMRDFLSFGSGAAIAGMLLPARRRVGSVLERLQYGRTMAKRRALQRLGRDLLTERDLDRLASELLTDLCDGLELEVANLFLVEPSGSLRAVASQSDAGSPRPAGAPEEIGLDDLGPEIWAREVEALTGISFATGAPGPRQRLFLAGYRYAFPLTVRGRPVGLLVTGFRLGEIPLSSDDLDLVRQLAGSAALAIENARLLDELAQRLDEVVELQSFSAGIIESSPAGIAVLDPEDRVLTANAAFSRLVEAASGDLTGIPVEELLPAHPLPEPGEGLVEISYQGSDGVEHNLQLSLAAFQPAEARDPSEALRVLLVHDVTERVSMEKALREKDRLAALGILAAGVAHEVNTPITGISSYAQMLLAETPEDDPRHEILKKVEKQTFRAARIVNNLLEFARNRTDEIRPVDLVPLVNEGLDLLNERRSKRGVRLELSLPEAPLVVMGSDGELQQVITNLALNAIDAMPDGGTLTVTAGRAGRWAELAVADTGSGIPADQLERIFEPFFSTKLGRGGTGLGLSISHDIIRRHGGDVEVESEPGDGTRFTVRLPFRGQVGDGGGRLEGEAGPARSSGVDSEPGDPTTSA
jgi:signal transduction histidine kinase